MKLDILSLVVRRTFHFSVYVRIALGRVSNHTVTVLVIRDGITRRVDQSGVNVTARPIGPFNNKPMNIVQQVFASVNPPGESKPRVRLGNQTKKSIPPSTGPGKGSPTVQRYRDRREPVIAPWSPRRMRERTESKSLTELEATLKQLTNQLRQSQASLAKITDQNLALEAKNAELESLRDKLAKSADRTSDKLSNLEREYDEDMTDQEEHWKFRFTELQFELEELRQTKQQ